MVLNLFSKLLNATEGLEDSLSRASRVKHRSEHAVNKQTFLQMHIQIVLVPNPEEARFNHWKATIFCREKNQFLIVRGFVYFFTILPVHYTPKRVANVCLVALTDLFQCGASPIWRVQTRQNTDWEYSFRIGPLCVFGVSPKKTRWTMSNQATGT